jgi:hypothetical protein
MSTALGRSYTDEEKQLGLSAVAACRGDATKAAQFCRDHYDLPVSADQLARWDRGENIAPSVRINAERLKGELSDKFLDVAHRCVDLLPDKLPDASAATLATVAGIATDKYRLLTEQSTSNISISLTPEQRATRLQELFAEAQKQIEAGEVVEVESEEAENV